MAVRMGEHERVPVEYMMEGNMDEAIRAYLIAYEADEEQRAIRTQQIKRTASQLLAEGRMEEGLVLLGLLTVVYPEEAASFEGLGDMYLTLAIENYREVDRLSGELNARTPALEYILDAQE